ncbi:geranylgeranyl reductase family protein [Candidatus Thorarchaeota archaeon]|nr:MAG: geranylgeranyl reductase family protein [Candidatus Thorarchaeota archaeon]
MILNTPYDIAVVGAGPAGATTAGILARKGFKTALIDRRSKIGVPIHCGELLPTISELYDIFPRSKRLQHLGNIPKIFVTNKTTRTQLISPQGHVVEFKFGTNIIDRTKYDQYLANQAFDAGCEIYLKSTVISRTTSNHLELRSKNGPTQIDAKIVVGADGPNSLISKTLGNSYTSPDRNLSPAINFIMSGVECDDNVVQMFFGKNIAPGGYTWIIPKGDSMANVGFGIRRCISNPETSLLNYLKHFIAKNKIAAPMLKRAKVESRVGAIIPVAGPVPITSSDNAILVGDAAGHVMASNGGGIPTALAGGSIAGHVIAAHLHRQVPLNAYDRIWKYEFGKELNTALSTLRIADSVMTSDSLTHVCMRLAGKQFLEPLIRCRLPAPVDFVSKTFVRAFNATVN